MEPTIKNIKQNLEQPDALLTISENSTATEATHKMNYHNVGCLVVLDSNGKFIGVLSERDMLTRVLTESSPPDNILVKNIMTSKPVFCNTDTTIVKAEQLMAEHKIRHVPVVENGIPVGMISSRDVIDYRLKSNEQMKIAAEQIAILSAKLTTWEFEDIVKLAINETPKSFGTGWALLYLNHPNFESPMIYHSGCPLATDNPPAPDIITTSSPNGQIVYGNICERCEKFGAKTSRLLIPLNIYQKPNGISNKKTSGQGFLCMCRLDPSAAKSEESQLYKASLIQDILNANLTHAHLYKEYQKMQRRSMLDALTGVGSRRMLEKKLCAETSRAKRYDRYFSVAIIDIDHFKEINDNFGHHVGDNTLKQLAQIMQQSIRECDILARYGGDEFVLLLPETRVEKAAILLERLRVKIESSSMTHGQTITISCGATQAPQSPGETVEKILKRADDTLYEAKHSGRNQIVTDHSPANTI